MSDEELAPARERRKRSRFSRIKPLFVVFGGLYVAAVGLLTVPLIQSQAIYLNAIRIPLFADFNAPEKYGLAPNKTINLKLKTPDNVTIGAWFVLSDNYYHSLPSISRDPSAHITPSLRHHPTILFCHGNAATRAFGVRVMHYQAFSSRLGVNVLAIDYRGFADSTGSPSELGLVRDARTAWDWLISNGAKQEDILLIGHSLGTGVVSQLAAELSDEDVAYRGVVLLSPFSSIREVLNTYHIFGLVPLMRPISHIPWVANLVTRALIHKFDTLKTVTRIKGSVLISHAENDWEIPYTHSEALFNAFLEPYLPNLTLPENVLEMTRENWDKLQDEQRARSGERHKIVKQTDLPHFGTLEEFTKDGRSVTFLKTLVGGHDYLGVQEGVQDAIGRAFHLV